MAAPDSGDSPTSANDTEQGYHAAPVTPERGTSLSPWVELVMGLPGGWLTPTLAVVTVVSAILIRVSGIGNIVHAILYGMCVAGPILLVYVAPNAWSRRLAALWAVLLALSLFAGIDSMANRANWIPFIVGGFVVSPVALLSIVTTAVACLLLPFRSRYVPRDSAPPTAITATPRIPRDAESIARVRRNYDYTSEDDTLGTDERTGRISHAVYWTSIGAICLLVGLLLGFGAVFGHAVSGFAVRLLVPPILLVIGVCALVFRALQVRVPSRAASTSESPTVAVASPGRRRLHAAGIVLGVLTLVGSIAVAGLAFVILAASSAMGGATVSGQLSVPLLILLSGSVLGALLIAGGRVALVSVDPVMARRGALAQMLPALLMTGLVLVYVVLQFVLPNVGSARYYHDYSADYDLSDDIVTSLADQAALHGVTLDWISIQMGGYESELGFEDSEWYLIDYLCERNGVEPGSEENRADLECSLVEVEFQRNGITYSGYVPIHNRVDDVVNADTYRAVVMRRVVALWELDAAYWIRFDKDNYYLNCRDAAPLLTQ